MDVLSPREAGVAACARFTRSYTRTVAAETREFIEQEREQGRFVPGLLIAELVDGRLLDPEGATNVRPAHLSRATA